MQTDNKSKHTFANEDKPTSANEIGCGTTVGKFISIMITFIIVAVVAGTIRHCSHS